MVVLRWWKQRLAKDQLHCLMGAVFRSPVQQHDFNFTYQLESGNGSDLPSSAQMARRKRKVVTIRQEELGDTLSMGPSTEHPTEESGGAAHTNDTTVDVGEDSTPTIVRRRGPTKMKDVWKLPNDEKILVSNNPAGQPTGDGGNKLAKFCGVIARNSRILPLSYETWSKIPKTTKEEAFSVIKQKFYYADVVNGWVDKSVSKKWRDYKSFLKGKYYVPERTEAENARAVPVGVTPQDWQFLVNFWRSETGKRKAEIGIKSRKMLKLKHTTGSASFAVVRDELEASNEGEKIGDVDFFETTHTGKDGKFKDDVAANIVKDARKKMEEMSSSSTADPLTLQYQVLSELRGHERPGRVRGMGLGPTPTSVFGSRTFSYTGAGATQEDVDQLKATVARLEAAMVQMATLVQQQSQGIPTQASGQRIPSVSSHARTPGQNNDGIGSNSGPNEDTPLP